MLAVKFYNPVTIPLAPEPVLPERADSNLLINRRFKPVARVCNYHTAPIQIARMQISETPKPRKGSKGKVKADEFAQRIDSALQTPEYAPIKNERTNVWERYFSEHPEHANVKRYYRTEE